MPTFRGGFRAARSNPAMGDKPMMARDFDNQNRMLWINWNELIPKDHLLRKIDEMIDFSFIYDKVEHLYSHTGRPSIDPVKLFKMTLIGYLYGIPSERRLEEEVRLNLAYRWFVGLQLDDPVPDHSTFSQNRRRRYADAGVYEEIFNHLVALCVERGLVTGELVVTDSTHIKADVASGKNETTIRVTTSPSEYLRALDAEAERLDAELKGRRKAKDKDGDDDNDNSDTQAGVTAKAPKTKEVKISKTDPDARLMHRTGKPRGYYYLAHQTIDTAHGIIVDVHTTPGNVNDHIPYGEALERIQNTFALNIKGAAADRAYDQVVVHRTLNRLGIKGYIPRHIKRGPAKTFRKDQFEYVAEGDFYRCPGGHKLSLNHISRTIGQKVYAANAADCANCPLRAQCVPRSARVKHITRPFFQDDADITHSRIGTEEFKLAQRLRRIWAEGTFAVQKRLHNLGRARMRGRKRVHEQSLMAAIAVNIKRMVKLTPQMA